MTKLALLALVLVSGTAVADVTIMDNKKTIAHDCAKDKTVNIVGNKITLTLTGTCDLVTIAGNKALVKGSAAKFYVAGNENTVEADAADDIAVPGNRNTVTWKRGATKKAPSVSAPGKDNSVSQAK